MDLLDVYSKISSIYVMSFKKKDARVLDPPVRNCNTNSGLIILYSN